MYKGDGAVDQLRTSEGLWNCGKWLFGELNKKFLYIWSLKIDKVIIMT